ncbi:hypothetical protein GCM10010349_79670 [Streptomyces flavofungini]|nr:hypothetical protein GCM10010349_79670 [Streptomyces flavofungini]
MRRALLAAVSLALTAVATNAQAAQSHQAATYKVTIHTADIRYAGTDGDILVTLFNGKGEASPETLFDKPGDDFERDDTETYDLAAPDSFGPPTAIQLRKSGGNGWGFDSIRVVDPAGAAYTEPTGQCQGSYLIDNDPDSDYCKVFYPAAKLNLQPEPTGSLPVI